MNFRMKLEPEVRQRLDRTATIIAGHHAMSDSFLAHTLLRLARAARDEAPDILGNPRRGSYDTSFVWSVIPIVASRLAAVTLLPNEGRDADLVSASDSELRRDVGTYLRNIGLARVAHLRRVDPATPSALDLISHEFVNGNPVAIAIDRISPPDPAVVDRDDWLATHMREISRARFGEERFVAWRPAFQLRMDNDDVPEPEADEAFGGPRL